VLHCSESDAFGAGQGLAADVVDLIQELELHHE